MFWIHFPSICGHTTSKDICIMHISFDKLADGQHHKLRSQDHKTASYYDKDDDWMKEMATALLSPIFLHLGNNSEFFVVNIQWYATKVCNIPSLAPPLQLSSRTVVSLSIWDYTAYESIPFSENTAQDDMPGLHSVFVARDTQQWQCCYRFLLWEWWHLCNLTVLCRLEFFSTLEKSEY